jgi:hypothetical protein
MRRQRGCYVFARGGARESAKRGGGGGLYGEWRSYSKSCCCAEQRRFRNDQVTRRDSVARRAMFDSWRLAAEQVSQMTWSVNTGVVFERALRTESGIRRGCVVRNLYCALA